MMAGRPTFHAQLSSVMETMARSVLIQVCNLVEEDSSQLRLELSRLLLANSTLTDKVHSLECKLTAVRSEPPKLSKSYSSVGVQTVCDKDGDACVIGPPTIQGIFGKDWCMNLWKDRDSYSLEEVTDSPESSDKIAASLSDQMTVTDIKEMDYAEDAASRSLQETLGAEEHDHNVDEEPQQLSAGYLADSSTCNLSLEKDGEQAVSAGGIEEPSMMSVSETAEAFYAYVIPIEEDDDDDVQFVQESQQESAMSAEGGPSPAQQQPLPSTVSENSSALDQDSREDFNKSNVATARRPKGNKFTCHICNRTFFHRGTLTHHMKAHKFPRKKALHSHTCLLPGLSKSVSKSCELCGKPFANASALRIHYVVHTGEKPHRCSLCGKGFTQKGNLKCHLRIHTGERPFHCAICGKTFTQKVNLNHHLTAHRNREVVEEKLTAAGLGTRQ